MGHPRSTHACLLLLALLTQVPMFHADEATTPCDPDAEIELKKLWEIYQDHGSGEFEAVVPGLLPHLSEDCSEAVRRKRHSKRPNIVRKHSRNNWPQHRGHLRESCARGFARIGSFCRPVFRFRRSTDDQESRSKRSYFSLAKYACPKGFRRVRQRCVPWY